MPEEEQAIGEKDEFLEDNERPESSEQVEEDMHTGERTADVYTEEGREEAVEEGGMDPHEEAWAEGAVGKGQKGNCASCNKVLSQDHALVEKEIDGETVLFCSDDCANKGTA